MDRDSLPDFQDNVVYLGVFRRTPPLGFATRQPQCGCFTLKSPPTKNLETKEERNVEKWCWVIRLLGEQYTADTANSKLGLASFMVVDCKQSVGSLVGKIKK